MKNLRINGQPRAKIIRYLGVAHNDVELEQLKRLGQQTIVELEAEAQSGLFGVEDTYERFEQARLVAEKNPIDNRLVHYSKFVHVKNLYLGFHDIYGRLYRELGLHRILPRSRYRSSSHALFHAVMARLANPASKRRNSMDLASNFGIRLSRLWQNGCTTNLVEYSLRRDSAIHWIRSDCPQFARNRLPNAIETAVQLPALNATS